MSIYSALVIFFCILLGYGAQTYAQIFSLLSMGLALILCNLGYFRNLIKAILTDQNGALDIGLFWQPQEYAINENFGFTMRRYFDEELNEWVDKALIVVDGKVLNPNGFVKIIKG
jgi:hypothetical protein